MADDTMKPSEELVQAWWEEADLHAPQDDPQSCFFLVAKRAAQWGADQELEACCDAVSHWYGDWHQGIHLPTMLRSARRPKPPSMKHQALLALSHLVTGADESINTTEAAEYIRHALEALPND